MSGENFTRREFLKAAGVVAGTYIVGQAFRESLWKPTDLFEQHLPGKENLEALSMKGALRLVRELDKAADAIEPLVPEPPQTRTEIYDFAIEVLPYFQYEGISQNVEMMPEIDLSYFGGVRMFHIAGMADCRSNESFSMWLNLRYMNKYSPWFKADALISTLVHELAHSNQASCALGNDEVETTTQLVTTEVLAAMTNHGNKYAFYPFIQEVKSYATSYLLLRYLQNDDMEGYKKTVVEKFSNTAFGVAGFEKAMDFWKNGAGMDVLEDILIRYGARPYLYMVEAMTNKDYETRRLPLPNPRGVVRMNDTHYVLEHLNELVEDYHKLDVKGE